MSQASIHLPHFPRLFPAWVIQVAIIGALWAGLGFLYFINVPQMNVSKNDIAKAKEQAMTDPLNPEPHLYLARILWENNRNDLALRELSIAESLNEKRKGNKEGTENTDMKVLGVTLSPLELISAWEGRVDKTLSRYHYWLNIAQSHPTYRDAYLLAGVAAYQAGRLDDAKRMLEKANRLDPNNETVNALSRRIL